MKKIITVTFITLVSVAQMHAQIEQGSILIGGSAGFTSGSSQNVYDDGTTSVTTDGPKTSSFSLMPWFGYMVTEDFAAGIGIGMSSTKSESTYVDFFDETHTVTAKTSMTTVAPGARFYYVHLDMTHLWAGLSIPIGFGKTTYDDASGGTTVTTETKLSSFGVSLSPGATINIGEKCGLEVSYGSLGFSSWKETTTFDPGSNEDSGSDFGLDWAGTFRFGIIFVL